MAQGRAMAAVDAMVPLTLLPLYLYKAPLTLMLLSHTGAVAQCRAMVAVDAMVPLTLIPMCI